MSVCGQMLQMPLVTALATLKTTDFGIRWTERPFIVRGVASSDFQDLGTDGCATIGMECDIWVQRTI